MSSRRPRTRRPPERRLPVLPILLGAVVALGVLAIVLSLGSRTTTTTTRGGVSETQPVSVEGAALPPMSDSADPALGARAPSLRGKSFTGAPVAIVPDDGRPKLVMFLAHWCPHCQREVPVVADWIKERGLPSDVGLYSVSTSADPRRGNWPPSTWLDASRWPLPVLVDDERGSAATAYGLRSFPFTVLINRQGKVVQRIEGEIPRSTLQAMVEKLPTWA